MKENKKKEVVNNVRLISEKYTEFLSLYCKISSVSLKRKTTIDKECE